MSKSTKIILSIVGVSAIVIPAVLMMVLAGKAKEEPAPTSENRQIDGKSIEDVVKKSAPAPQIQSPIPSPSPSPSASPVVNTQGTPSAQ